MPQIVLSHVGRHLLNRRDFLQLALLAPGVLPAAQNSELSQRGGFAMHASGGREEFNSYLIDGVDNNDHYENSFALQPPVDSIQEFKIATSAYSAEYGRAMAPLSTSAFAAEPTRFTPVPIVTCGRVLAAHHESH